MNKQGYVKLLKDVLCGDFASQDIARNRLNFNSPNQTDRYDPVPLKNLIKTNERGYKDVCADVNTVREVFGYYRDGDFQLENKAWAWRATEHHAGSCRFKAVASARSTSGCIYVTSGRSDWFGKNLTNMPIVLWCLRNGLHVDILVDPVEANAYKDALFSFTNLSLLRNVLDMGNDAIMSQLSIITPVLEETELADWPRGFGFNRMVSVECMKKRFQDGRCLLVDDNTGWFNNRNAGDVLAGMLPVAGGQPPDITLNSVALRDDNWLCIAFSPCTVAPSMRPLFTSRHEPFSSRDMNIGVAPNVDRIPQQLTLWNTAVAADTGVNYDPRFLTGKEDVELFRRLKAEVGQKIYRCNDITLGKCKTTEDGPDQNPGVFQKKTAMLDKIIEQVDALLGEDGLARVLGEQGVENASMKLLLEEAWYGRLCQLAYNYTIDPNLVNDAWSEEKAQTRMAELLVRQNRVIEQYLVLSA
jgi:hypothetical protein